ncbi:hypothetical protein RND64_04460 [Gordonia sp. w5E2]|mgnify:CR=1 FL=1|uniref:hypothetical protein n=1 Tax=Gordonia TaxID=2053 RepID=UPI0020520F31|nr:MULTISPECIES: hypothetical protein [Gordonia]DAI83535.1 MAG TPA: head to tail adaptor [Caudoviricetes sp.]
MTTPAPLVTVQNVCTTLAREVPANNSLEFAQLSELCEQAADEIRHRVVAVDARISAGTLSAVRVRGVAVDMVIAAVENIDLGFRSTGEQYPEVQTSNVAAANRLTVEMTESQRKSLMPPEPNPGGMYNVSLSQ